MTDSANWTVQIFGNTVECHQCSAIVPNQEEAMLNHERWHERTEARVVRMWERLVVTNHNRWSDFDWALFLLDGAEQSLVDEFHAQADPRVMNFLAEHQERRDQLRREYATNERVRQEYQ